jgi:hypothetical protein
MASVTATHHILVGSIRATRYGGALWDVRERLVKVNYRIWL